MSLVSFIISSYIFLGILYFSNILRPCLFYEFHFLRYKFCFFCLFVLSLVSFFMVLAFYKYMMISG